MRAISEIAQDLQLLVSNPYVLLTATVGQYCWFSVLGLKDTFPCIPAAEEPLQLSAFWWWDPETQGVQQYCWTVLPQGLKTSPTSFGELLARAVTPMCVGDLLTTSKVSAKYRKNNYSANADGMAPRRRLKYVSNKSCTWVSSSA